MELFVVKALVETKYHIILGIYSTEKLAEDKVEENGDLKCSIIKMKLDK